MKTRPRRARERSLWYGLFRQEDERETNPLAGFQVLKGLGKAWFEKSGWESAFKWTRSKVTT